MKKTYQNRKFDYTHGLSVSENASTNCPPNMNKAVKDALLKEIKEFSETEARKEAEDSARGKPSIDAYNTWLDQNGGHEPIEANPDTLSEDNGLKYLTSNKDCEMTNLLTEIRQLFSKRELQVWNLVMKHNMSYKAAADLLNISKSAVQIYIKKAKAKFIKYMEEKRDAR